MERFLFQVAHSLMPRSGTRIVVRQGYLTFATKSVGRTGATSLQRGQRLLRGGGGLLAVMVALHYETRMNPFTACAPAAGESAPPAGPNGEEDDEVSKMIKAYGPLAGDITMGAIVGFSSGYALKKVGKLAAFVIGVGFITAQTLTYLGYINVNWSTVERQVVKTLDQDGDDKLTAKDLVHLWQRVKKLLTYQMPSSGGFAAGFALGFYQG